ncbi:unnamed protein product [Cylicostephanus goldi]|uniref:Uncharacterized protein n=1 Tax=Cylicostephanus goldi TaxID=71465 RepID=A0A3P7N7Q0_CYLGO|nr:unnamed protein product [Cylicostephanus goldi]
MKEEERQKRGLQKDKEAGKEVNREAEVWQVG